MYAGQRMASEAAGTAPKAEVVALGKSTMLLCLKSEGVASAFSHEGGER